MGSLQRRQWGLGWHRLLSKVFFKRKTEKERCRPKARTGFREVERGGGSSVQAKVGQGCGGSRPAPGRAGGPRAGLPGSSAQRFCSAPAQLLLPAAKATEITTTSNFLQEPHTGGEKISQAFPMKSFPQALPTPRASWLGAGPPPPPSTSLQGALGEGAAAVCRVSPD